MTNEIESDLHLVVKGEAFNLKESSSIDVPTTSLDDMVVVVGDISSFMAPEEFALSAAYPNPFNPITTLRYDLPEEAFVSITIYDMLGNVVNNLVNANQLSGYKSIQWNATNNQGEPVSAGVYLYKIQAGDFVDTKKMILLK